MEEANPKPSSSGGLSIRNIGDNRGATLVEIIAVVSLLGLIGVGIYSLSMMPVRALEGAHKSVVYEQSLRTLFRTVTGDLSNVIPSGYVLSPHFSGTGDRLQFAVGTWEEMDRIRLVQYTFERRWTDTSMDGDRRGRLIRTEMPLADGAMVGRAHLMTPNFEGEMIRAARLRFEYFDGEAQLWLNEWGVEKEQRPAAVRITFSPDEYDSTDEVQLLFPLFTGRTFRGGPAR